MRRARAHAGRSCRSIAVRCPRTSSRASSSGTCADHSAELFLTEKASSKRPTAGRSSSTRLANYRSRCRRSCSGRSRRGQSGASAPIRPSRSTFALSPRRTDRSPARSMTVCSARTFITDWPSSKSHCRRSGRARKISHYWPRIFTGRSAVMACCRLRFWRRSRNEALPATCAS
jgi:hypothetical protein